MIAPAPTKPAWLPKEARRGWNNENRQNLAAKHGSRDWSIKGILTRIFGQGIQRVFQPLPATTRAAISGSMGVAVYDMMLHKRDLNWKPNDVDVFVAVPRRHRNQPLKYMFPIMTKWLRSVRDQGFLYELKPNGTCYSEAMCIFDFECTNASEHPGLHLPTISFIGRPADSVRDICQEFDLPICGPILYRRTRKSLLRVRVTTEIQQLYKRRRFYSKVRPTWRTPRGRRTKYRIEKYEMREFQFFLTDYDPHHQTASGKFPRFPPYYHRHTHPVCKQFIIESLGREPTEEECTDFNIAP